MADSLKVKEELLATMDRHHHGVGSLMAQACDAAEADTLMTADFSQQHAAEPPAMSGPQMCSEPTVSAYGVWVSCVQSLLRTQLTHEEGTLPGDLETQLEELYDELSLSGPVMPEPAPDVASPPSNVHGSYGLPEHSLPSPADPPQQLGPAVMSPAPPATCFENSKAPKPYFEGPKQPGPVVLPTSPEPCVPSPADPAKHLLGPAVMHAAPATVPAKLCLEGPTLPRPVLLPTPAECRALGSRRDVPETSSGSRDCLEGPTLAQPVLLATPAEAPWPGPADPAEHLGPAATPCVGPAPTAVPAKLCLGDPTLPQPCPVRQIHHSTWVPP